MTRSIAAHFLSCDCVKVVNKDRSQETTISCILRINQSRTLGVVSKSKYNVI
jgi:hypothetical protein